MMRDPRQTPAEGEGEVADPGEARAAPDAEPEARPKDRLIQARVPRDLESTLKREARRRRLTVSHLIRNVLEDAFQLVDDVIVNVDEIVADSVELARRVGQDARRVADAIREPLTSSEAGATRRREGRDPGAREAAEAGRRDGAGDAASATPAPAEAGAETAGGDAAADPLAHVYAWNRVVLNRAAACSRCARAIGRGEEGYSGLSDAPDAPRAWLCAACLEAL